MLRIIFSMQSTTCPICISPAFVRPSRSRCHREDTQPRSPCFLRRAVNYIYMPFVNAPSFVPILPRPTASARSCPRCNLRNYPSQFLLLPTCTFSSFARLVISSQVGNFWKWLQLLAVGSNKLVKTSSRFPCFAWSVLKMKWPVEYQKKFDLYHHTVAEPTLPMQL